MLCCPNTRRVLAGGFTLAVLLLAAGVVFTSRPTAATAEEPKVKADPPAKADAPTAKAGKSDHVCFGGDTSRNMVNLIDKGIPHDLGEGDEHKLNDKLLKWKADLGSRAYGGPIIANGKVLVGTN